MKTILISLFMMFVLNMFSQTKLDKLVFKKINEYRKQKGLHEFLWDEKAYKASDHHLKYLLKNSILSHSENNNTPTPYLRLKKYGANPSFSGENAIVVSFSEMNEELIANDIVNGWKGSPGHNENMLSEYKKSAVSCGKGIYNKFGPEYKCMFSNMVFYSE